MPILRHSVKRRCRYVLQQRYNSFNTVATTVRCTRTPSTQKSTTGSKLYLYTNKHLQRLAGTWGVDAAAVWVCCMHKQRQSLRPATFPSLSESDQGHSGSAGPTLGRSRAAEGAHNARSLADGGNDLAPGRGEGHLSGPSVAPSEGSLD